jgi:two-component system response regulator DesR
VEARGVPVRCVVADDHPSVLGAVSGYLDAEGVDVVARARNGREALEKINAAAPAVAVLDLRMPGLSGIEVAKELVRLGSTTAVILFTGDADRDHLIDALDAGARGFVLKEGPLSDLLIAVNTVAAGGTYIDALLASTLANVPEADKRVALTELERDVLRLLANGSSYEQIGAALAIAPEAARAHAQDATSRLEALIA